MEKFEVFCFFGTSRNCSKSIHFEISFAFGMWYFGDGEENLDETELREDLTSLAQGNQETPTQNTKPNTNQVTFEERKFGDEVFNLEIELDRATFGKITKSAEDINKIIENKRTILDLLESYTCYDLIPESGKIVVLDSQLSFLSALKALEENHIKSAPLWDSIEQDFVGIITVTDFIQFLVHFHRLGSVNIFDELRKYKIKTWKEIISENVETRKLISIEPDDPLAIACKTLLKYKFHRIPIMDMEASSILHILTHYRVMVFMMQQVAAKKLPIFNFSPEFLNIGTFKNIATVYPNTPLHEVLTLLYERRISAVPVISEEGKLIDIYSNSDLTVR
jgi:CBS domain-containing protein